MRRRFKCKDLPINQLISEEHFDLINDYKKRAKFDLYVGFIAGVIAIVPSFITIVPICIISYRKFNFSINSTVMTLICIILTYLLYILVLRFPFRKRRINKFNPNDENSKCCYGTVTKMWSSRDNGNKLRHYVSISINNTDLVIKRFELDSVEFPKIRSNGGSCILVSYDNVNTYLIPITE